MLRHVVGDATFNQILRQWVVNPSTQYGTAVSADFETVAESVSGKDLTTFFNQWLYRPRRRVRQPADLPLQRRQHARAAPTSP